MKFHIGPDKEVSVSRKGGNERSREQVLFDRAEIARRYLQGQPQHRIAEALGLSQAQISLDLRAVRQEWLRSSLMNFNERKAMEIAKLDRVERAAWEAYEGSKDGRFLVIALKSVEQRCRLLGLDTPARAVQVDTPEERQWEPITPEERASRILVLLETVAARKRATEAAAAEKLLEQQSKTVH